MGNYISEGMTPASSAQSAKWGWKFVSEGVTPASSAQSAKWGWKFVYTYELKLEFIDR